MYSIFIITLSNLHIRSFRFCCSLKLCVFLLSAFSLLWNSRNQKISFVSLQQKRQSMKSRVAYMSTLLHTDDFTKEKQIDAHNCLNHSYNNTNENVNAYAFTDANCSVHLFFIFLWNCAVLAEKKTPTERNEQLKHRTIASLLNSMLCVDCRTTR